MFLPAEQPKDMSRAEYLLRAAYNFIEREVNSETWVYYDGTECDGYCIMEDIENTILEDEDK